MKLIWVLEFFLLLFVVAIVWSFSTFPKVDELLKSYPHVRYLPKEERAEIQIKPKRPAGWISLGAISPRAVHAIIVSEDWAFYSHPGYDLNQIKESMETNWRKGRYARGASTITQQVAKNVYLSSEKSIVRKLREFFIAVALEKTIGKRRILEIYLNIAEWGQGIYGIGAASNLYFHKSPADLSAKEGAFLAMLLPSPKRYSVSFRKKELSGYARKTIAAILAKMVRADYLSEDGFAYELADPLAFEILPEPVPADAATSDDLPVDEAEEVESDAP